MIKINKTIKDLKKLLGAEKNTGIQMYLRNFSFSEISDYPILWKIIKKLK